LNISELYLRRALFPASQPVVPPVLASKSCVSPVLAEISAQAADSTIPRGRGGDTSSQVAHTAPRCNFYLPTGARCACPALRGRRRCRHHQRIFKPRPRNYALPPIEDAASLHAALLQICRAIAEDAVSPDAGRILLWGAQLAANNLKNLAMEEDVRNHGERD